MNSDHKSIRITIPAQKQGQKKRWAPPRSWKIETQGLCGERKDTALQQRRPINMLGLDQMITNVALAMPHRRGKKIIATPP